MSERPLTNPVVPASAVPQLRHSPAPPVRPAESGRVTAGSAFRASTAASTMAQSLDGSRVMEWTRATLESRAQAPMQPLTPAEYERALDDFVAALTKMFQRKLKEHYAALLAATAAGRQRSTTAPATATARTPPYYLTESQAPSPHLPEPPVEELRPWTSAEGSLALVVVEPTQQPPNVSPRQRQAAILLGDRPAPPAAFGKKRKSSGGVSALLRETATSVRNELAQLKQEHNADFRAHRVALVKAARQYLDVVATSTTHAAVAARTNTVVSAAVESAKFLRLTGENAQLVELLQRGRSQLMELEGTVSGPRTPQDNDADAALFADIDQMIAAIAADAAEAKRTKAAVQTISPLDAVTQLVRTPPFVATQREAERVLQTFETGADGTRPQPAPAGGENDTSAKAALLPVVFPPAAAAPPQPKGEATTFLIAIPAVLQKTTSQQHPTAAATGSSKALQVLSPKRLPSGSKPPGEGFPKRPAGHANASKRPPLPSLQPSDQKLPQMPPVRTSSTRSLHRQPSAERASSSSAALDLGASGGGGRNSSSRGGEGGGSRATTAGTASRQAAGSRASGASTPLATPHGGELLPPLGSRHSAATRGRSDSPSAPARSSGGGGGGTRAAAGGITIAIPAALGATGTTAAAKASVAGTKAAASSGAGGRRKKTGSQSGASLASPLDPSGLYSTSARATDLQALALLQADLETRARCLERALADAEDRAERRRLVNRQSARGSLTDAIKDALHGMRRGPIAADDNDICDDDDRARVQKELLEAEAVILETRELEAALQSSVSQRQKQLDDARSALMRETFGLENTISETVVKIQEATQRRADLLHMYWAWRRRCEFGDVGVADSFQEELERGPRVRDVAVQNDLQAEFLPKQLRQTVRLMLRQDKLRKHLDRITTLVDEMVALNDQLQGELQCKICHQLYTDPLTLWPCGHSFCAACVETLVIGPGVFQCCVCDEIGTEGGIQNNALAEIVGRWQFKSTGFSGILASLDEIRTHLSIFRGDEAKKKLAQLGSTLRFARAFIPSSS